MILITRSIRSHAPLATTRRHSSLRPSQPSPPSPPSRHHTTTAIIYTITEPTPAVAATPLHPRTTATVMMAVAVCRWRWGGSGEGDSGGGGGVKAVVVGDG
nr:hypothetical protein [Tanacetum cinerariifolium]